MKYTYHLLDDGGMSTVDDIPFRMDIGTKFLHEYGYYQVRYYRNDNAAVCERLMTIQEYNQDK